MADDAVERPLATVFTTNVVACLRLAEADEKAMIARQRAHRTELIGPKINAHRRNIFRTIVGRTTTSPD